MSEEGKHCDPSADQIVAHGVISSTCLEDPGGQAMTMEATSTIQQLAKLCSAQVSDFRNNRACDERPCLELFRLALIERNQEAWEAIYNIHYPQVVRWVHTHPHFRITGEDADYFANQAFSRLWQYGTRHACAGHFNAVADYMQYLKRCTWSAIEDELRRSQKDALWHLVELGDSTDDNESDGMMGLDEAALALHNRVSVEAMVENEAILNDLWELLRQTLEGERERIVAEEMWEYGLAPRQIYARHPDRFADENEVSQIRRNIVRRLNRRLTNDAKVGQLRQELEYLFRE
ncbi:MAG: hypothetical protein RMN52_13130 [Anaerolineae bacterium]|nr:hypothetical protein [Candidatus Roseilinea sp.]MDW8450935.1 hypothetical protein [Anaerolineae bacterium]